MGLTPTITFVDNPSKQAPIKIFEEPEKDGQYIIFGDVGENHDRCVATVLNKRQPRWWQNTSRSSMQEHSVKKYRS